MLVGFFSSGVLSDSERISTLTISTISKDPLKATEIFLPLAKYMEGKLAPHGIQKVVVLIAADMKEIITLCQEKKIDLYFDSPLVSLYIQEKVKSRIAGRRWKKGVANYHSVIFTKKESAINSLKDLQGKLIAFEEPFSSSGYYLPKIELIKEGLDLKEIGFTSMDRQIDKTTYKFSQDDQTTATWVLRDRIDAGAMSNKAFEKYSKSGHNNFKIIGQSIVVPRHLLLVAAHVPKTLEKNIKNILFAMDQEPDGKKALMSFNRTKKIDALPPKTIENLQSLKEYMNVFYK